MISDVTYRIHCEEVAPLRARRKTRVIVHFNRLKPYRTRPVLLQPSLHDVEEDRNLPTDPNVGEQTVLRSPLTTGPAPMENAAVISDEPDARVRRSERSRHSPTWMGDFLLGEDFDNALPPLGREGREGVVTLLRESSTSPLRLEARACCVVSRIRSAITQSRCIRLSRVK